MELCRFRRWVSVRYGHQLPIPAGSSGGTLTIEGGVDVGQDPEKEQRGARQGVQELRKRFALWGGGEGGVQQNRMCRRVYLSQQAERLLQR